MSDPTYPDVTEYLDELEQDQVTSRLGRIMRKLIPHAPVGFVEVDGRLQLAVGEVTFFPTESELNQLLNDGAGEEEVLLLITQMAAREEDPECC